MLHITLILSGLYHAFENKIKGHSASKKTSGKIIVCEKFAKDNQKVTDINKLIFLWNICYDYF
jgi:hypothetical protein